MLKPTKKPLSYQEIALQVGQALSFLHNTDFRKAGRQISPFLVREDKSILVGPSMMQL